MGDAEDRLVLGGGIELEGFKVVDLPSMVIVKKMVGRYARSFSDNNEDYEKLLVRALNSGKRVEAELSLGGKNKLSKAEADNVFMALDDALKGL